MVVSSLYSWNRLLDVERVARIVIPVGSSHRSGTNAAAFVLRFSLARRAPRVDSRIN
jgi:hypothetical protein